MTGQFHAAIEDCYTEDEGPASAGRYPESYNPRLKKTTEEKAEHKSAKRARQKQEKAAKKAAAKAASSSAAAAQVEMEIDEIDL
eukprot:8077789-Prorocentrum_lima.AAC.1